MGNWFEMRFILFYFMQNAYAWHR